jgi:Ca2+-binding EF-hand superfamily protein
MQCEALVVKKLENISNFSKDEIEELQIRFNTLLKELRTVRPNEKISRRRPTVQLPKHLQSKMNDYQGSMTIGISKEEFLKILSEISPSLAQRGEEIFIKFDEDASGYLDFRELTIAMSVLSKGTFEDKLRIFFDAYDTEHCGYLGTAELNTLIEQILLPLSDSIQNNPESEDLRKNIVNVHLKMSQLCEESSGKVFFNDFVAGIKSDMLLFSVISDYIGNDRPQVTRVFNAINLGTFTEKDFEDYNGRCRMCTLL